MKVPSFSLDRGPTWGRNPKSKSVKWTTPRGQFVVQKWSNAPIIPYPSPGPKGWGFQLTGALLNCNPPYMYCISLWEINSKHSSIFSHSLLAHTHNPLRCWGVTSRRKYGIMTKISSVSSQNQLLMLTVRTLEPWTLGLYFRFNCTFFHLF